MADTPNFGARHPTNYTAAGQAERAGVPGGPQPRKRAGSNQNVWEGETVNATLKKTLTSALVASMVFGATTVALAKGPSKKTENHRFGDWQQIPDYALEALNRMAVKGVMKGDAQGRANPSAMITNAEAAAMVVRFLGEEDQALTAGASLELKVEDENEVPDWARQIVALALKNKLFDAPDGRFQPQHHLTRLEAAKLLVKAAKLEDEAQSKMDATLPFKDAKQISAGYAGYVAVAYDHGWMLGDPNGMFHPWKPISRAEWATLLNRVDTSVEAGTDARQIKGTLTAVNIGDAPSISLTTPVFPGGVTYPVDDTAVFFIAGRPATIADLQVGDSVVVNLSSDQKVLAITVVTQKTSVKGIVDAVTAATDSTPASITLQASGTVAAATYEVLPTAIVKVGETAGVLTDVKAGDRVSLTIERGKVTAIKVDAEAETYVGEVTAIAAGADNALPAISLKTKDGQPVTFTVADYAQILSATGANVTLADVKAGDQVELRVQRSLVIRIRVRQAAATPVTTSDAAVTAPAAPQN